MRYRLYKLQTLSFLLLLTAMTAGCHADSNEVSAVFYNYRFDPRVINSLPLYDSLLSSIEKNMGVFQKNIDPNDSYKSFRYKPGSAESGVFNVLPKEAGPEIEYYFSKLGKDLIYRFDVFTDSTIKIYISNRPSSLNGIYVEENLSYFPAEASITKKTFPAKDTLLNRHCQYWMRVSERRFF